MTGKYNKYTKKSHTFTSGENISFGKLYILQAFNMWDDNVRPHKSKAVIINLIDRIYWFWDGCEPLHDFIDIRDEYIRKIDAIDLNREEGLKHAFRLLSRLWRETTSCMSKAKLTKLKSREVEI